MIILIYTFLWLFVITNVSASVIYIGYYFLFVPQFNAALPGWFMTIISLIEIPLIIRVAQKKGTRHPLLSKLLIICNLFLILLTVKISSMAHVIDRPITVSEILTVYFVCIHIVALYIIASMLNKPIRHFKRTVYTSLMYLAAVTLSLVTMALVGEHMYRSVQTTMQAERVRKAILSQKKSTDTSKWIVYEHKRKPSESLPGFRMLVPQNWDIDDQSTTVSTSSAKIVLNRRQVKSNVCLYPDTIRNNVLYNNNLYIFLSPVMKLTIDGRSNTLALLPVKRHSTSNTYIVCERWIRFDGLIEYTTEIGDQTLGNISVEVTTLESRTFATIKAILESITILP